MCDFAPAKKPSTDFTPQRVYRNLGLPGNMKVSL